MLFQSKTAILQAVVMYLMRDTRVQLTLLVRRGGRGAGPGRKACGSDLRTQLHLSDRDTSIVITGEYRYQMTQFSAREEILNLL